MGITKIRWRRRTRVNRIATLALMLLWLRLACRVEIEWKGLKKLGCLTGPFLLFVVNQGT
jgi:hypothetical protein